jgi:methyl-accepting chemotaxis protein
VVELVRQGLELDDDKLWGLLERVQQVAERVQQVLELVQQVADRVRQVVELILSWSLGSCS